MKKTSILLFQVTIGNLMKKIITILVLIFLSFSPAPVGADIFDLQAEINNAPNGGTVVIPCGVYDIGGAIINLNNDWQKVVTIQGCGHAHLGQSPAQGHSQWDYLLERGYYYGTVLRGTITVNKGARLYIRDVSLIGYGSGIAIDYGDGTNMFAEGGIENVSIGNYDIGIRLRSAYYMSITDVSMAGVGIGLQNIGSNVITVSGLNIVACGTGLDVTGNGNVYIGGSVQGCGLGMRFGGFGSTLTGFYFEQDSAAIELTGRGHVVLGNYYASNAGAITISGHNNHVLMSEMVTPVILTGNYNRVSLSAYGSCNDSGFRNVCERLYP